MKIIKSFLCIILMLCMNISAFASNCSHDYTIKDASNYSPEYESLDDTNHIVEEFYDKICESCGEIVERKVPEEPWEVEHNIIDGVCEECGFGGGSDDYNSEYDDSDYSDDYNYDDNYYSEPEYPASDEIQVFLNGEKIEFDVEPQIINGRTMVPVRAIFEALGADVSWDGTTQTVTAYLKHQNITLRLMIGRNTMEVVGSRWQDLDSPPVVIDGRTLVPVRVIAEKFKCNVKWDGVRKNVIITNYLNGIDTYQEGYYTFAVVCGGAIITSVDETISGEIKLPSSLGGYPIIGIGYTSFYDCDNMTELIIPDGVQFIDDSAFYFCTNLKNVSIPDSVTSISGAFSECTSLEEVSLPNGIETIEGYTFINCHKLKRIFIPSSVKSIGLRAFDFAYLEDVYYSGTETDWNNISMDNCGIYVENIKLNNLYGEKMISAQFHPNCNKLP